MVEFGLTEEQTALRATAAKVAAEVYAPLTRQWEQQRTFMPPAERKRLADLGFLGITLPTEVGGSAAPLLDALLVIEEVAKRNQVAAFQIFEANTGPARVVDLYGSDEQKERLLPPILAGVKTLAVAISEPDAGSAATDLTTRATLDGEHYVVTGTKRWCSGGGHAEQYLVYVRLSDARGGHGIGAIVVDGDSDGITFGPQERLHGFKGIPSADILFDDVRVPAGNLIVGEGGFGKLFRAFSIERLGNATMSLAIGQTCLDRTAAYVQQREQFGKPLVQFQLVQAALADMILQVEAARLLIWRAAANADRSFPVTIEASMAKCFSNEMAKRVSESAMQLHGGYGYSEEYDIERLHRDAHGWAVAGGTADIQRIRIVSEYLGRNFNQRS